MGRVIEAVDAGQITLIVSTVHIVEARGEGRGQPVDVDREARLLGLFDNERVVLVEFDRSVARRARTYTRSLTLNNYDAVHMASAVEAGADVFFSTDKDFPYDSDVDGVWVSKPYNLFSPDLFLTDG
jgi:predicted nucleic acid-binding protein